MAQLAAAEAVRMTAAKKLDSLPVYVFAILGARLQILKAQGLDVIRLDIGSLDGPPPVFVVDALSQSATEPSLHSYTEKIHEAARRLRTLKI